MDAKNNCSWNLNPLFSNDDDEGIERNLTKVEEGIDKFVNKWKGRNDYCIKPEVLLEALDEYEAIAKKFGTSGEAGYYFLLRTYLDMNEPSVKAKYNQIEEFDKQKSNKIRFFILAIGKIKEDDQDKFLSFKGLGKYKHYLEQIFRSSKYMLSEEAENLLSLKRKTAYDNWVDMVMGLVSKEEREVKTEEGEKKLLPFSNIMGLINSQNKEVRDKAAEALNDIFKKLIDVAEIEFNSVLMDKKINDELRKMERVDLARHIDDDVDSGVVDALIESVSARNDIAQRYYALKAKIMGKDKLAYHERNVPIGKNEKKYDYTESFSLVYHVLNNLDEAFGRIIKNYAKYGQIDAYPKKGKRTGACCIHNLLYQPTYILLNHTDKLRDVTTLAHEVGHGINSELMKENQHALYFGTPKSTAEVASTFMEDFVFDELLKEADDETKLSLLMMQIGDDISTIFRQSAFYKFELEVHNEFRKSGYLSKEDIGKIFQKHMISYMGEAVNQDAGSENWWLYVPHFRDYFYVYSYVSGILISKSLQEMVKKDKSRISEVKEFLGAGTSESPKNLFLRLGIDITKKDFWNKGLNEMEMKLNETEKLAKKLGKI